MKKRSFVVIGLGPFGGTVATELARMGHHVLGVCSDAYNVNRQADELAEVVQLDFRDEDALRDAGIGNHDVAIIAISNDLEASILCTMNVKLMGIKTIWAKATSRTHHRILTKLGVDRVVLPEIEIGQHVAQMLNFPTMRDYVSLGNGFVVVDMNIPDSLEGQTLDAFSQVAKHSLTALGLMRGQELMPLEDGAIAMKKDDKLLLLGRKDDLRDFGRAIRDQV